MQCTQIIVMITFFQKTYASSFTTRYLRDKSFYVLWLTMSHYELSISWVLSHMYFHILNFFQFAPKFINVMCCNKFVMHCKFFQKTNRNVTAIRITRVTFAMKIKKQVCKIFLDKFDVFAFRTMKFPIIFRIFKVTKATKNCQIWRIEPGPLFHKKHLEIRTRASWFEVGRSNHSATGPKVLKQKIIG